MKKLLPVLALLLSANAFAFSPSQVAKSMADETVAATLEGKVLTQIKDGPSFRCAGCFGLIVTTLNGEAYQLHGMEFGSRFNVSIAKIEANN